MRKSCGNYRRHNSLASRVHQNSPRTRLLASKPHDAEPEPLRSSFPDSMQEIPSGLAKRLCVPPAQGFRHLPAFAIALMR